MKVNALGDFAVTLLSNLWCKSTDVLHLRLDLTKAVKEALDDAGIDIPFPTNLTYQVEMGKDAPRPRRRTMAEPVEGRPDDDTDS